ncbi:MAG: glutamine--tRNA ligase, partial [Gemmatimonadetes bacterium]|nr:glutamine--tRNA ligase [Gemmatimonadota bacterium]
SVGVSRKPQRTEIATFEHAVRNDLNAEVPRVLCVTKPLKVVITNYPEGQVEELDASYYPHDVPKTGSRKVPFSRELWVERDDFMEDPPKKFFRLAPGREVRLRYGYFITCQEAVKNDAGDVVELRCTYDPATRGGDSPDGRKVQGTIHWVSAAGALDCELRMYDRLFSVPDPEAGGDDADFIGELNPDSLTVMSGAKIEPSVADDAPGSRYQFERTGYFMSDPVDSAPGHLVFNRTVTLRDGWAKVSAKVSAKVAAKR